MPAHHEIRTLPYSPEQMFTLVADIERYPEFLPWCLKARVRERKVDHLTADLVIGYSFFRETYTSHVTLAPFEEIIVEYGGGPMSHLENRWHFRPTPGEGSEVEFYVDFSFSSSLLQRAIEGVFTEALFHMIEAFEKRAADLYGKKDQVVLP